MSEMTAFMTLSKPFLFFPSMMKKVKRQMMRWVDIFPWFKWFPFRCLSGISCFSFLNALDAQFKLY